MIFYSFHIFLPEILLTVYNLLKGKSLVLLFWSHGFCCFWQYRLLLIVMFTFAPICWKFIKINVHITSGLWKKFWKNFLTRYSSSQFPGRSVGVYEEKDCGVKNYPCHHPFLLKSDELSILTHFVNGSCHKL